MGSLKSLTMDVGERSACMKRRGHVYKDPIPKKTRFSLDSALQKFNPKTQRSFIHALQNAMSIREAWSEHASIDLAFWILPGR